MGLGLGALGGFFVQAEGYNSLGKRWPDAYDGACAKGQQHIYAGEP